MSDIQQFVKWSISVNITHTFLTIVFPGESAKNAVVVLVTVLDGIIKSLTGLWVMSDDG